MEVALRTAMSFLGLPSPGDWVRCKRLEVVPAPINCRVQRSGSIFGGIEYFGLAGIIAGPVVFSVTAALLRILREMLEEDASQPEPS